MSRINVLLAVLCTLTFIDSIWTSYSVISMPQRNGIVLKAIRLDTVADVNYLLKVRIEDFTIPYPPTVFIDLDFNKPFILNESIKLDNASYQDFSIYLVIRNFAGFVAGGFPIFSSTNKSSLVLKLPKGSFNFFNRHLKNSSCESYLKSFHNLNDTEFQKANKSQLVSGFRGPFGLSINEITLFGNVAFDQDICPLVFKGARFENLYLIKQVDTTLLKNRLRFSDFTENLNDSTIDVDCEIQSTKIQAAYYLTVDGSILNRHVFKKIQFLSIGGSMISVQEDIFKSFKELSRIQFLLASVRDFFHTNYPNKWLKSINWGVDVDPDQLANSVSDFQGYMKIATELYFLENLGRVYHFPEEDFCLYAFFPHRQLVFFLSIVPNDTFRSIDETNVDQISCAFLYLDLYSGYLNLHYGEKYVDVPFVELKLITRVKQRCNFMTRLEYCNHSNQEALKNEIYTDAYKLTNVFQWIELVGPVITFPIVSTVGFLFNLLTVLIIRNKFNQKQFFKNDRLFKYILINSCFNMVDCFLSALTPISECLGENSFFCSSIMYSPVTANFKIYVMQYFGECMKTCSIITMLAFSLERFINSSDDLKKYRLIQKFQYLNLKRFVVCIVILSLVTCSCKIFEFSTRQTRAQDLEYPEFSILLANSHIWFQIIYAFHYLLNDFFLLVLNFSVDLKLVLVIRRNLRKKRANIKALDTHSTTDNPRKAALEIVEKAESNTNKLIGYTFIIYLFCRIPELIFYLSLLFFHPVDGDVSSFAYICFNTLCYLLVNSIQYLYMLHVANKYRDIVGEMSSPE